MMMFLTSVAGDAAADPFDNSDTLVDVDTVEIFCPWRSCCCCLAACCCWRKRLW